MNNKKPPLKYSSPSVSSWFSHLGLSGVNNGLISLSDSALDEADSFSSDGSSGLSLTTKLQVYLSVLAPALI